MNSPPPLFLEFRRNKHISSHFFQELKTPTKNPPPKQTFISIVEKHQKKVLRGLHSKKLKTGFLQWESDAPLMHYFAPESVRPMLVLFTLHEKCPNTKVFILRIFPYSVLIRENTVQKKLRIWTLFTQC